MQSKTLTSSITLLLSGLLISGCVQAANTITIDISNVASNLALKAGSDQSSGTVGGSPLTATINAGQVYTKNFSASDFISGNFNVIGTYLIQDNGNGAESKITMSKTSCLINGVASTIIDTGAGYYNAIAQIQNSGSIDNVKCTITFAEGTPPPITKAIVNISNQTSQSNQ